MGTWTTTEQTVDSWSDPIRTETGHPNKSGSYNWYHFIKFYIGRRTSDKAVVIKAELYGGKQSGWGDQSGSWSFGAKRSSEGSFTTDTFSKTLTSSSWNLLKTYYYVDLTRAGYTYEVEFYCRSGEGGDWETHTMTIYSAGTARVKASGAWKEATPYVRVGGVWKEAQPFVKVGGVWKEAT